MYAIMGALALILGITIPLAIRSQNSWEAWCADQGGHVTDSAQVVTTVSGSGKVGTGVSTTYYCLSADGRILDVQ